MQGHLKKFLQMELRILHWRDIKKITINFLGKKEDSYLKDFENYKIRKLNPICGDYRSYKICSMPPPSSGGIALIQMLNILENDLKKLKHNSIEYLNFLFPPECVP